MNQIDRVPNKKTRTSCTLEVRAGKPAITKTSTKKNLAEISGKTNELRWKMEEVFAEDDKLEEIRKGHRRVEIQFNEGQRFEFYSNDTFIQLSSFTILLSS